MATADQQSKLWGFLVRRPRWGISWRGWVVMILGFALMGIIWVFNVRAFLAPTQRADTKILVVEGWVQDFAIQAAVKEFQAHHYEQVYATGGPVVGNGGYINDFNTSASVGAEALVKAGIPGTAVQMAPSHVAGRDRTYNSALALREYFRTNGLAVKSFNVLTEDVHARRTWLLFRKAFGPEVNVGIVSVPDPDYDPAHWWRYSEGVREILGESIAWCYAEFVFHPTKQPRMDTN